MGAAMRLILVGETNEGSRTRQRLRALRDLGHDVTMVSTTPQGWRYETRPSVWERLCYHLRMPVDSAAANAHLRVAAGKDCDAVLLDNARMIRAGTLRPLVGSCRLLWYSEDDTMNPIHRTRWMESCLPLFDLWVTTKSFNAAADEVPSLGVRRTLFVNNSFCPHDHAPMVLDDDECRKWGADIGFVGTYEAPRARDVMALAQAGMIVRIWGNGWNALAGQHPNLVVEGRPVYGDDYRRVVAATRINLCFLRQGNRDLQTCRSLEIPAMRGFMMHQSSSEMESLFAADREAVYFGDTDELVAKARSWLTDHVGRDRVAAAGRQRAVADGHDHVSRWRTILDELMKTPCAF